MSTTGYNGSTEYKKIQLYNSVQRSTTEYNWTIDTTEYNRIQRYNMVQQSTPGYNVVQKDTTKYNTIRLANGIHHGTIEYNRTTGHTRIEQDTTAQQDIPG